MSAVTFALSYVRRHIPKEVLDVVFTPTLSQYDKRYRFNASTIDMQIREKVIEDAIRRDVDSIGASEVLIPIGDLPREPVADFGLMGSQGWVVRVPRQRLNGRSITSPLSVAIGVIGIGGMGGSIGAVPGAFSNYANGCGTNAYTSIAQDIINSAAPIQLNQTAHVHLIGENTVFVEDFMPVTHLVLRALVSSDMEFSFIRPTHYRDFGKLVLYAVQGYIHTNYRIRLEEGQIHGGVNISEFKNVVDGYSDAWDNYETYMEETFRQSMSTNDRQRSLRLIRGMAGARGM